MKIPGFLAQIESEESRERLRIGVVSGYVIVSLLAILVLLSDAVVGLPDRNGLILLCVFKLFTNTLQWRAVRQNRRLLLAGTLNVLADLGLLTAAVHATGGVGSLIESFYIVILAVVGLLANPGVTVLLAALMILAYSGMIVGTKLGFLAQHPNIGQGQIEELTWGLVTISIVKMAFSLAVVAVAVSAVLWKLRGTQTALEQANRELREASKKREAFLSSVTHELKTPIHGILGLTELVTDGLYGEVTSRQVEALGGIERGTTRLLAMIEDLLQFQRVSAGNLSPRPEEFELTEIFDEVLEEIDWAGERTEVHIQTTVPSTPLYTDRRLFRHVVRNLVANALKFSPQGGTVSVDVRVIGADLLVSVSDEGPGIPPEEQHSIFEEYWEVRESPRAFGGTGLSLAVSKSLSELLGGELRVENHDEKTTFSVRFSAVVAQRAAAE